ncbi:aldose epimerase family protein [Paracoccus alkanivorans]|uniref:Aldose 1-epimerase n=1 Tax=Paracoccus alkanivorans TaxID=2116655 RepID=A0A3M0MKG9_9RHOB|nr:aldose epimerase family protein [Paracoccus alkanivorans]RMC37563.1 galactose mutarotase [Paracoccus alkanivorans]
MSQALFGKLPDGREVHSLSLQSGRLSAKILTLGAILQDLRMEDVDHPLVLGTPAVTDYLGPARYFGAIVGRFANRIGEGSFTLDGKTYRTDPNFRDRHTLHGGSEGIDTQIWQVQSLAPDRATLTLDLPDGHMGFPGTIWITAGIHLAGDELSFTLSARTDAPTICSLAHHGFFDLDGRGDIRNHSLMIDAGHYLPVDDDLIPTGEIRPVDGSDFDFRSPRRIGSAGYDHNFCLSDGQRPLCPVARLTGESGLSMQVETTACGLQFYDGAYMRDVPGLDGRIYGPHAGLALETQHWPDAPNRPGFPDAVLRPGQVYSETTIYRFIA